MKKSGFTLIELIGIVVIIGLILLVAVPTINNVIERSEENKKQEALNNIYMATENYLMANYDEYSSLDNIGASEYIYVMDLINQQYIDIDELNPNDDESFDSKDVVKVTRNEDNTFGYELTSLKTLIETLLEQYTPGSTTGLLVDESNSNVYYYKGTNDEVSNNYLWYGGHHWRVVEIDTDANTLLLISQQPLTAIQPASAVWTTQESYESSYINTWLNEYFYNSLDSSVQNSIISNTFNIGIYTDVDEITTSQKVGLLDEDQYTRAGGADSYLDIKDVYWLGNRYISSYVRSVSSDGSLNYYTPAITNGVRAVIKISDITITGGNGTLEANYEAGNKATNTSDIQVGEYINMPYSGSDNACGDDNKCTFRVVSKDSDSIKVVLNGLLPTTSKYDDGGTTTITTSHTIYTPLNTFANNISSDYRYTGNKIFYIGDYPYVAGTGQNYKDVQDETLSANVGLPTVGEMFSGNDIDLGRSSTKTFVDVNTIENPTESSSYWMMNRQNSSYVRSVGSDGRMSNDNPSITYGVRAVIYLKSGTSAITFTGGEGTAEQPYELE